MVWRYIKIPTLINCRLSGLSLKRHVYYFTGYLYVFTGCIWKNSKSTVLFLKLKNISLIQQYLSPKELYVMYDIWYLAATTFNVQCLRLTLTTLRTSPSRNATSEACAIVITFSTTMWTTSVQAVDLPVGTFGCRQSKPIVLSRRWSNFILLQCQRFFWIISFFITIRL